MTISYCSPLNIKNILQHNIFYYKDAHAYYFRKSVKIIKILSQFYI